MATRTIFTSQKPNPAGLPDLDTVRNRQTTAAPAAVCEDTNSTMSSQLVEHHPAAAAR